jgi:hypothetical protein
MIGLNEGVDTKIPCSELSVRESLIIRERILT